MAYEPKSAEFEGERVTVVGLGVEGVDLVHYFASRGARVTVSDGRTAEQLGESLDAIRGLPVGLALGGNRPSDILEADAVYVSQGVPWRLPVLEEARARGVTVSSMTRLFLERCPVPVAGITGSSGKTTTTALVGAILEAAGIDHVVGGNIGVGLLGLLERIGPETKPVVELSHTQLQSVESSPQLACITNITPNHLDRFTWDEYVALKRRIFEFQDADGVLILNADDAVSRDLASLARGRVLWTALSGVLPGDGVTVEAGAVVRRSGGTTTPLVEVDAIRLRGRHNVANVLAAAAVAMELGASPEAVAAAAVSFAGVPHRLEPVSTVRGVTYVNDSIATTPERTLAGMRSFGEPLVLLLGGRDKDLPLAELAAEAVARCRAIVTFGEAGPLYASAVRRASGTTHVVETGEVASAVVEAAGLAEAGDVVLFSPAGTSFDAYPNFEKRGEAFRAAVGALAADDGGAG